MEQADAMGVAREPSFTAMWHAWMRNAHANGHRSPIFADTLSAQLVPDPVRQDVVALMGGFSGEAADALILMAVVRYRLLADRLPGAHDRGIRQFVMLGAGLDTSAFALPALAQDWQVFEVDHPATQEWKRHELAARGWRLPANLVFAPCDFEAQKLLDALDAVGFERDRPALVSLFGVVLYLTAGATKALLSELASLAPGSEVVISYSPPPGGPDPVLREVWGKSSPKVDETGESFIGHYTASQIEQLATDAGFRDTVHYSVDALNTTYLAGRPDGLELHAIEQLLIAVR
jgi:methyltransferase (TIGR00027 family)